MWRNPVPIWFEDCKIMSIATRSAIWVFLYNGIFLFDKQVAVGTRSDTQTCHVYVWRAALTFELEIINGDLYLGS